MTAIAELERIASRVVAPGGSTSVVAIVDVEPCDRLQGGGPSGLVTDADGTKRVPRTRYGAAWFDGRRRSEAIHWFDRPGDARAFIRILTGEAPTARPAHVIPAAEVPGGREPDRGPLEPPALSSPTAPAAAAGQSPRPTDDPRASASEPGTCPQCGGPMPAAGHGQRRLTCSDRCRTARARGQRAEGEGGPALGTTTTTVTASRAPDPTPRPAGHFVAAPSRSGSAEGPADLEAGQTELGF